MLSCVVVVVCVQVCQALLGSWDQDRVSGGEYNSSPLIQVVAKEGLGKSVTTFNSLYSLSFVSLFHPEPRLVLVCCIIIRVCIENLFFSSSSSSSCTVPLSDTGLFGVYVVAPPTRLQSIMWWVTEEMRRLAYDVSEARLHDAKQSLIISLLTSAENSTTVRFPPPLHPSLFCSSFFSLTVFLLLRLYASQGHFFAALLLC